MKRITPSAPTIESLLRPETELERRLLQTPEFQEGMNWGEPRFGHPEGMVFLHVREVLDNIECIPNLDPLSRERLRTIAIAHDVFKFREDRSLPRDWSKHHGVLARKFMQKYTDDKAILDVIESHDDAYYAWRNERHPEEKNGKTLEALLARVGHSLQLYYLFFKCDTQTGDKTQAPWKWFERVVPEIEITRIRD